MKISRIKQLSLYGFGVVGVSFFVTITILMFLLFSHDKIREEKIVVTESYGALLKLKDSSEILLTTNNLHIEKKRWSDRVDIFNQKLLLLKDVITNNSNQLSEIFRLWSIAKSEVDEIKIKLQNPLLEAKNTTGKSILRILGENFQTNSTSDFFIAINDLINSIVYLTQYENFIIDEFNGLNLIHEKEEGVKLENIHTLITYLPPSTFILTIIFSIFIAKWMSKVEFELIKNQKLLEEAQRIASVGHWEFDIKNSKLIWSDEVYHIFKLSKDKFGETYDNFLKYVHPEDIKEVEEAYWSSIQNRETYKVIHRLIRPDNSIVYVEELGEHTYNEKGEPIHTIGVIQDITEVELYRRELQAKVDSEVKKRRKQENILIQQSKLASMGEMISNIAHQWRQPLNALGVKFQDISEAYEFNELTPEYLDNSIDSAMDIIEKMSTTIDKFRLFFRPDEKKQSFNLKEAVENSLILINSSLKYTFIETKVNIKDDIKVSGYKNEFSQAILNILTNAKDVLKESENRNKFIKIDIEKVNAKAKITIYDNGGGIDESIIDKIFEPYFTTKFKSEGTGVGLYMSKMIIEKGMNGFIYVENIEYENGERGAKFIIEI